MKEGAFVEGAFFKNYTFSELRNQSLLEPDYCEYFYASGHHKWRVDYYFESNLIATKTVLGSMNESRPETIQRDDRFGELRELKKSGSSWFVNYQERSSKPIKSRELADTDFDVNDAGFDVVIREKWQDLLLGEKFSFAFLSKVHRRSFKVDLKYIETREGLVRFRLNTSNPLLGLFSAPIFLWYEQDTRRLKYYEGTVNLLDKSGKTQKGLLIYNYR